MNKSEIAERAQQEIRHIIICDDCKTRGIPGTKKFNWPLCDWCIREVDKIQPVIEYVYKFAESQAPQPNPNCPLCQGLGSWIEGEPCGCMKRAELNGEPSPPPVNYDRDKVRQLEREIELQPGNKFVGWKLGESGAAQEVSPLTPVITISHGAPPGIGPGPSATGTTSDPRTGYLAQDDDIDISGRGMDRYGSL